MEIAAKLLSFDSSVIFRVVRHRAVRFALATGIAVYFVYHLTGFKLARIRLVTSNVDTFIIFVRAQGFRERRYPEELSAGNFNAAFPYPPPAVALFDALGILGLRVFAAIWVMLLTGGLLVTFRASVAGDNDDSQSAWLAFGALALVFSDYPVSSDLRLGNSDLVYLGLVLAAYSLLCRRSWFAGVLWA